MTEIELLKKEIEFLLRSRESLWEFCKVLRESNHSMVDAVKEEREACARVAEERLIDKANCTAEQMYEMLKTSIAESIRARGQE